MGTKYEGWHQGHLLNEMRMKYEAEFTRAEHLQIQVNNYKDHIEELERRNAELLEKAKYYKMKAYGIFNMLGDPEFENVGTKGRV